MASILISGIDCVFPDGSIGKSDIFIENGRISSVAEVLHERADRYIDGDGLCAMPALFDMHVHFRDPGLTHKEDIFSGCASAIAGGFSGVACMPNTKPPVDSPEVVSYILDRAKSADFAVFPIAAVSVGMRGEKLSDFEALKKSGAVAVSDDGRPVESSELMRRAIALGKESGLPVISHCEDLKIINGGIINKGEISENLGVAGMDRESENSITEREILIAEKENAPIHIAHVSTKESVDIIRKAKKRGVAVSCETCPHYFCLTDEKLMLRDADYRMNPPLREESDRLAVIDGLRDGTIDCIVTDHAPHTAAEKADFLTAPNGIVGLETSLAAALTELYGKNGFSLAKICQLMCVNPRRLLGLHVPKIKSGSVADIVIFDPDCEWRCDPSRFKSKSCNTAFKRFAFKGRVLMTIINGKIRYEKEKERGCLKNGI